MKPTSSESLSAEQETSSAPWGSRSELVSETLPRKRLAVSLRRGRLCFVEVASENGAPRVRSKAHEEIGN